MSKILPIDIFFMEYLNVDCDFMESMREQLDKCSGFNFGTITDTIQEYTKLHVQAALKAAYQNATVEEQEIYDSLNGDSWNQYIVNKNSIMNAYPLTNIE
jgi:hypothetical protein